MARHLVCASCGVFKPTHPEDAALGLFSRYVPGAAKADYKCDYCGKGIAKGSSAVCISVPGDKVAAWETEYVEVSNANVRGL